MNNRKNHQIYIQVVKQQSLTKAADSLGLSKSTISRVLSHIEHEWGAQLLIRSTRSINVTEAGQEVYQHYLKIITETDKTKQAIEVAQTTISGAIRITAPEAFGSLCLAPILKDFLAKYPETRADIVLSSDYEALIEEEFDLAFRIGSLQDSTLKAKTLIKSRLGLFASPAYFEKENKPKRLKDLLDHNCLIYTGMPQHSNWFLALGENDSSRINGNICSNNEMFLIEMARTGQGLLLFPELLLKRYLQDGELEQVMPDYSSSIDVSVVYPFTNTLSNKLRLFIDYVSESLKKNQS